jgi:HD-GYP domain-containing protein (c-di-GMP phosphodiesterase class II)
MMKQVILIHKRREEIPLESLIIAIAESFDAITSDRPYRLGSSYEEEFDEVQDHVNDQFCLMVYESFNGVKKEIPPLRNTKQRVRIQHMAFVRHKDLIHSRTVLP